jgi:ankyrin repeat protein
MANEKSLLRRISRSLTLTFRRGNKQSFVDVIPDLVEVNCNSNRASLVDDHVLPTPGSSPEPQSVAPVQESPYSVVEEEVEHTPQTQELDHTDAFSKAFAHAAEVGSHELVCYLLKDPRCDITYKNCLAVKNASNLETDDLMEFILRELLKLPYADLQFDNNYAFRWAVTTRNIEMVKLLLRHPTVNAGFSNFWAVRESIRMDIEDSFRLQPHEANSTEIARVLLNHLLDSTKPDATLSFADNAAFRWAISNNDQALIKRLISHPSILPSFDDNWAVRECAAKGLDKLVKLLLGDNRVDPSGADDSAIKLAAQNGRSSVVKLLLQDERVDPSTDCNYPIRKAAANGHAAVVRLLLQDRRVDAGACDNEAAKVAEEGGYLDIVSMLAAVEIRRVGDEGSSGSDN